MADMPRKKRPRIARLHQVKISRDGKEAIIEFFDPSIATTHLRVGLQMQNTTDDEILLLFNRVIAAQVRNHDELGEYVAIEIPVGNPQVKRFPGTMTEWVPRGGVLGCVIEDGGSEDGSLPVIHVNDRGFTWDRVWQDALHRQGSSLISIITDFIRGWATCRLEASCHRKNRQTTSAWRTSSVGTRSVGCSSTERRAA